jgi:hypothetical protein
VSEEKDTSQKRSWRDRFGRGSGKMTPARRRTLVTVGVVALVVVILVVIPGYVATRPRYLQRYGHLSPSYQTWNTSVHAQVPCQKCHVKPGLIAQTAYSVKMLGQFYASLVLPNQQPKFLATPTNAACQSCHLDLRTVSPSGDLNIPHRAHVTMLKMDCVKCHSYLVHQPSPEGKHTPRMATCLTCHNGRQAKNACSTCHTNKALPDNHRAADWVVIHPQMQDKVDCKQCHAWTSNWCAECHSRRPRSHGVDWRAKHGLKVQTRRNCEVCHQAAFCIRCHGENPSLNFDPTVKLVK